MTSLRGNPRPAPASNGSRPGPGTAGTDPFQASTGVGFDRSAGTATIIDVDSAHQLQCAAVLSRLHAWVESVVPSVPPLASMVTTMLLAIDLYVRGRYQECLSQALTLTVHIQELRILYPALPPL
jgi:hypothetical protein